MELKKLEKKNGVIFLYGHYNVTTPSFFVFSAGDNKKNELQFGQNI